MPVWLSFVRASLGVAALIVCVEIVLASVYPRLDAGESYFLDWDYERLTPEEAAARGMIVPVEPAPRYRANFIPNTRLRLRYEPLQGQDWFDEQGSVPVVYNSRAVRDREELCEPKPAGQRRIVFLGDSITVGWGIRIEDTCCRLTEDILREQDDAIRTVNCGASGTLYVDEYANGLEHRFGAFEPDVVVVNLTVNDVLHLNGGIAHYAHGGEWWEDSAILRGLFGQGTPPRMRLDPSRDWVQELLDAPEESYDPIPRSAYWAGGGPQQALLQMRAWCEQHDAVLCVALWPSLQGTAEGEVYPFSKLTDLVAGFCAERSIPFLDLLPAFQGHDPVSLWVAPWDLHGNPDAQRLAAPLMAEFVRDLLPE